MNYFISDLHFGHRNIVELCGRPFGGVEEMNEALIANWNGVVKNCDTVYIVGDFAWKTDRAEEFLKRLKGKKVLIVGNHDGGLIKNEETAKHFKTITPYLETHMDNHTLTLCHYPMLEWRNSRKTDSSKLGYLIFGHIHEEKEEKYAHILSLPNALNAGADINNFTPATIQQLKENNAKFYSEYKK